MKKLISVLLTAAFLAAMLIIPASAEPDKRLEALQGSYIELFPEFAKEEFHDYWIECIRKYVDDPETAEMFYQMLVGSCMGKLKGQEAIDAYTADPDSIVFNCFFTDGIAKITVEGDVISGFDADNKTVFSHTYSYTEDIPINIGGMTFDGMNFHIYKADEGNDAFAYFAFADDTPAETYHLEFRYGPTLENIGAYYEGGYAYWLAAAIPADYAESSMMQDCIKLFVDENMSELAGEEADVIEIADAEGLAAINKNLSGNYVLTADIDLAGVEWTPIGTWVPSGESEEEQEIPSPEFAFTGTFDGNGHTISNLKIDQPEGLALGLFGCISGAEVRNFTVENASVDGSMMSADVVGYAFMSTVDNVMLKNGKVTAHMGELSAEGMFGGIVGAGMGSLISNCSAEADIVIPDGMANAGIIGGGLEMTNVSGCHATGTVTAGNDCYGLGGISGCGFAAAYFRENTAENVLITAGENCFWIGGITGYAGGFEDEAFGMPITVFENCSVKNVVIAAEGAEGVDEIVGAGFFNVDVAEAMGAPFDQPTVYELIDCIAE